MEEIDKLLLQEKILLLELDLVRAKISLARATGSMQQKEEIPCRETPVNTLTSKLVIMEPGQSSKSITIPEQTAHGKESTNPLMASLLPKETKVVQTTRLVKPEDFLRPNMGIPIPEKAEPSSSVGPNRPEKEIQTPHNNYYVVYNGPYAGIYDNWGCAKSATNGVPGVAHKKFATITEARKSADEFTTAAGKDRLNFVPKGELVKPKTFAKAVTSPKKSTQWITLGTKKPKKDPEPKEIAFQPEITIEDFQYLYDLGRKYDGEGDTTFFTTDKKNISMFNFLKNADPQMISECFQAGLIKTIYPSANLQEIKYLPKKIKDAVKKYRTNCIKNTEKDIFLKIKSTIPVWSATGLLHKPKYMIEIGVSGKVRPEESKSMESTIQKEELMDLAVLKAQTFIDSLMKINQREKIFVNMVDYETLVYSKNLKKTTQEDRSVINKFQQKLISGKILGFHSPAICQHIKVTAEKEDCDYHCNQCESSKGKAIVCDKPADSGPADNGGPQTREDASADSGSRTTDTTHSASG
ncbi:inclusion body matrix protein [Horseradish latent virus]|uniref:Transactivator/viroplasmin protein n=1 Tax=Horseradish latent virus TaxID=264076 RepID=Q5J1S0_9VIRU|nr:inclusion body matrix protein [Horseradish latent virus]AAW56090.1 inclusion body matrix protein [Horseradish latent virus]